jgi:transforming growth factor-beta-induced protein
MKLYRFLSVLIALALILGAITPAFAQASSGTMSDAPKTIVEIAAGSKQFSTLAAAVKAAGLADTLSGTGPFTVFAPTDAAFAKLPKGTLDALLKDPEKLKAILLYHVVSKNLAAKDVLGTSGADTAAGLPVVFTVRNGQPYINNARITATDIPASNGTIHGIDSVILPPGSDIIDTAAANKDFSTLVAAVKAAGLVDTLKGKGPFTIFAPTDAAFAKLPKGTLDALLKDPEKLKAILLYHAVAGTVFSGDVAKTASAATVNGADVVFSVQNGQAYVDNARIATPNILTTNGVIHVIDRVILPPDKNIVEAAAANPNFSTLVAAVKAAGLVDTLSGKDAFTILAPTNAAFNKLPKGTVEALLKDPEKLKAILLYHAIKGKAYSGDVAKLSSAETLNGQPVAITQKNGKILINNAGVTAADIQATNGVIHVIDTVLLPPDKDIVDTAAANPQFSTLVAAVKAAGLVDTLKGKGPFTVFAPTNAAFAKLPKGTVDALLKDPEKLKAILLYHAVPSAVFSADVASTASARTANGADVVFSAKNGQAYVNNARVTTTNIIATNGVIHVIDTVILPLSQDIVDTAAANPQFKTLTAALKAAGLVDTLKGKGPYTIFAPTDAAFAKLPKGTVDALLKDPEKLKSILLYHAVEGAVYSGDAAKLSTANTINGAPLTISLKNGQITINTARVVTKDILTTNGVIHVIDTVLLPPAK